jgi:hypothetical protein
LFPFYYCLFTCYFEDALVVRPGCFCCDVDEDEDEDEDRHEEDNTGAGAGTGSGAGAGGVWVEISLRIFCFQSSYACFFFSGSRVAALPLGFEGI